MRLKNYLVVKEQFQMSMKNPAEAGPKATNIFGKVSHTNRNYT